MFATASAVSWISVNLRHIRRLADTLLRRGSLLRDLKVPFWIPHHFSVSYVSNPGTVKGNFLMQLALLSNCGKHQLLLSDFFYPTSRYLWRSFRLSKRESELQKGMVKTTNTTTEGPPLVVTSSSQLYMEEHISWRKWKREERKWVKRKCNGKDES